MTQTPFDHFRKELNGRPGQPIVLGVCVALAKRLNLEPWVTRTAAIILALMFSFLTLVAYVVLGYLMEETNRRTSGFFSGLWMTVKEKCCSGRRTGRHEGRGQYY